MGMEQPKEGLEIDLVEITDVMFGNSSESKYSAFLSQKDMNKVSNNYFNTDSNNFSMGTPRKVNLSESN